MVWWGRVGAMGPCVCRVGLMGVMGLCGCCGALWGPWGTSGHYRGCGVCRCRGPRGASRVLGLELHPEGRELFVAFSGCIVRLPLSRCARHGQCRRYGDMGGHRGPPHSPTLSTDPTQELPGSAGPLLRLAAHRGLRPLL